MHAALWGVKCEKNVKFSFISLTFFVCFFRSIWLHFNGDSCNKFQCEFLRKTKHEASFSSGKVACRFVDQNLDSNANGDLAFTLFTLYYLQ